MSTPVDYTSELNPILQQVRIGRRRAPKPWGTPPTNTTNRQTHLAEKQFRASSVTRHPH